MKGQRTWKRWRRSGPFCLFCCARLPSGSAAPEAGCSLLCSSTQRRVREHSGKLGTWKPDGPEGMSLGAPEEWASITMWLLHGSFDGHDKVYGARLLEILSWCWNVRRVTGSSLHGVTSSTLCLVKLIAFWDQTDEPQ